MLKIKSWPLAVILIYVVCKVYWGKFNPFSNSQQIEMIFRVREFVLWLTRNDFTHKLTYKTFNILIILLYLHARRKKVFSNIKLCISYVCVL